MIGLVVNPVAGIGGPAGLAGSDGVDVQREAVARGARSRAEERAVIALRALPPGTEILTAAGTMGADAVTTAGLVPCAVFAPPAQTAAADTSAAVRAMVAAGATLVLFAGGDGTARDVVAGLDGSSGVAALGIPAGVKMYSPVFAVSPRAAGGLIAAWTTGRLPLEQREVLDLDETELRRARVEPRLYGELSVPYRAGRTQSRKASTPASEHAAVIAAARGAASVLVPGVRYLLGPGGTMVELARALGADKTLLGVDVVLDGRIVRAAASETDLLAEVALGPAQAVVSVIGGQGFLLGRGNQQLSARVLRALGDGPSGRGPLLVVAPEAKLVALQGRPLLVDTGDPEVDGALAGFVRVVTGPATSSLYPVHAPESEGVPHAS